MVGLLVPTSYAKLLFAFLTKQATIMRRSSVLSLTLQLVFPGEGLLNKLGEPEVKG
jgi:hypothetical protein